MIFIDIDIEKSKKNDEFKCIINFSDFKMKFLF